jgi:hypothetical protein
MLDPDEFSKSCVLPPKADAASRQRGGGIFQAAPRRYRMVEGNVHCWSGHFVVSGHMNDV